MKIKLHKFIISFFVILFGLFSFSFAQNSLEEGVGFYNQGNYKKAIESLNKAIETEENKVKAFHYLGLTYEKEKNLEKAVEYHSLAATSCLGLIKTFFQQKALKKISPISPLVRQELREEIALALKSMGINKRINSAYFLSKNTRKNELILKFFRERPLFNSKKDRFVQPQITVKPRPTSPVNLKDPGKVYIYVLFLSNGEIGLTIPHNWNNEMVINRAVSAAEKIRFKPATINGNSVSVMRNIQYNFTILY